jgi:hypothetical protein
MGDVIACIAAFLAIVLIFAVALEQISKTDRECVQEELEAKYGKELDAWKWAALHPHLQLRFIGYEEENDEIER